MKSSKLQSHPRVEIFRTHRKKRHENAQKELQTKGSEDWNDLRSIWRWTSLRLAIPAWINKLVPSRFLSTTSPSFLFFSASTFHASRLGRKLQSLVIYCSRQFFSSLRFNCIQKHNSRNWTINEVCNAMYFPRALYGSDPKHFPKTFDFTQSWAVCETFN